MKVQELQNAVEAFDFDIFEDEHIPDIGRFCLLYTSPSPRDVEESRMPSSA